MESDVAANSAQSKCSALHGPSPLTQPIYIFSVNFWAATWAKPNITAFSIFGPWPFTLYLLSIFVHFIQDLVPLVIMISLISNQQKRVPPAGLYIIFSNCTKNSISHHSRQHMKIIKNLPDLVYYNLYILYYNPDLLTVTV